LAEGATLAILPGSGDLFVVDNEIEMHDVATERVLPSGGVGRVFYPSPVIGGADVVEQDVFL
jgi:hypothetical protein